MSKKSANSNLHAAKTGKNDEFYTQLTDIEKELKNYKRHFKNKVVFLNCDDPRESNFWRYFSSNFEFLGLKKLISTHYESEKRSYKLEIVRDVNGDGKVNDLDTIKTPLKQNGDFRSDECIEILKEADIVVTNPPFSLFREYVALLMEYKKKFLVIGNLNSITYKEIFGFIKNNKLWIGNNNVRHFIRPDGSMYEAARSFWYTNLTIKKRNENIILYKKYKGNESDYPEYDNYNAIEVSKTADIPMDYKGAMGVPVTFIEKYNPDQFEIIGATESEGTGFSSGLWESESGVKQAVINGKRVYKRIFIKVRG